MNGCSLSRRAGRGDFRGALGPKEMRLEGGCQLRVVLTIDSSRVVEK